MHVVSQKREPFLAYPKWGFYSRFATVAFGGSARHRLVIQFGPFGFTIR